MNIYENYIDFLTQEHHNAGSNATLQSVLPVTEQLLQFATATQDVLPNFTHLDNYISDKIAHSELNKDALTIVYTEISDSKNLIKLDNLLNALQKISDERLRPSIDIHIKNAYSITDFRSIPKAIEDTGNFSRLIADFGKLLQKINDAHKKGLRLDMEYFINESYLNCTLSNLPDKIAKAKDVLDAIDIHINEIEEKIQNLDEILTYRSFPKARLQDWHFERSQKLLDRCKAALFPADAKQMGNEMDKLIQLIKLDLKTRDEKIRKNIIIFFAVIIGLLLIILNLNTVTAIVMGIVKLISWIIGLALVFWIFSLLNKS
jgi:hypothetical protein